MWPWVRLAPIAALLLVNSAAFAASEQDSLDCFTAILNQDPDRKVTACTHIIEDRAETTTNRAIAYSNRGVAYMDNKRYSRALEDFNEAIRLDAKNAAKAYFNRGFIYHEYHQNDRAIADLNEAIRLDASIALAYRIRAEIYEQVGRKSDAISDYRKTLLLDPSDGVATWRLKRLGANPF